MTTTDMFASLPAHTDTNTDLWDFLGGFVDDMDFMGRALLAPITEVEQQEGAQYWKDFASFNTEDNFGLLKNTSKSAPERWGASGDNSIDVFQTAHSLLPQGEEQGELLEVPDSFDTAQKDPDDSLFENMAAWNPLGLSTPPSSDLFSDSSYYFSGGEQDTIDPMELDREIELLFGFDYRPPNCFPTPPASPTSSRSKSQSPDRGPEDHVCPEKSCRQSFKRANALQRHIASIHQRTGEICPFCPNGKRAFNRSDNFQRHVAGRHKNIPGNDKRLQACLKRLYQGNGRRTSWKK